MAVNPEDIYEQYRRADCTHRLNIYLQFPELRDDFFIIEQQEARSTVLKTAESHVKAVTRIHEWISRRFSSLR